MAHGTRIFVSFSAHDAEWVRAFVEALRWAGCDVWYDALGGSGGPAESTPIGMSPEVERELNARSLFIAVLTPPALHSPRLHDEVESARALCARDATRQVLLVAAQSCRIPEPWRDSQKLGGSEGGGLVPEEAARRVREVLETIALKTRAAPALPAAPATAKHACERGRELHTQSRLEEALTAYEQAIVFDAVSPVAWCGRGSVLFDLGRHEDALGAFAQALAYDAQLVPAWRGGGDAHAALGDRERAVEAYERALALDAHHASTWAVYGDALLHLDRYAQAAEAYDRALALAERNPRIWRRKGDALQQLARQQTRSGPGRRTVGPDNASRDERLFTDALAAYDRALALEPRYLRAWNHKIHLLDDLGRTLEAARARRERAHAFRHGASRGS